LFDPVFTQSYFTASETPEQKAARKAAKATMDPAAKVKSFSQQV
jgi:hypothetical protein